MPATPALPLPLAAAPPLDSAGLVSDLLPLVDFALLLLAALAAQQWQLYVSPAAAAEPLPWVALGLAPFMLYDRHFGALAVSRNTTRLVGSSMLRALGWVVVVLGYAVFGDTLPGLHPPWLGTWLVAGLGLTTLARALALRRLAGPRSESAPPTPRRDAPRLATGLAVTLLADRPISRNDALLKAAQDKLLGGLIALLLLPLLALVALAIRLDSPGPVLFRQRRHGLNNAEFDILKFRTMRWAPAGGELVQTTRGDARITRLGRWLRASSVDELPQLFNVLCGDMSLVGPRPHAVTMRTEDRLGTEITDTYPHRHRVKPGITGWAQVNGARGATDTTQQLQRRVELDLHYIDHWSMGLDLKILVMTFSVVFRRTNAF